MKSLWCQCVFLLSLYMLTLSLGNAESEDILLDLGEVCGGYQHQYKYTVYVDPSAPIDDLNCDLQTPSELGQDQWNTTCPDITMALAKHSHRSSTAFVLMSAPNVTHVLKPGAQNFLRELTDVGFFGESSSNLAHVECEDGAGLAFWNVDRIRLHNVEFSFCGALRNTTSKNFTEPVRDRFVFIEALVGLYFYNGTDVTMCHVTVQHGPNSLGILMYDTDGTVNVYCSSFINNTTPDDITTASIAGGGGFNVEFSYCVPGDEECGSSRRQLTHTADSRYIFYGCKFADNSASIESAIRLITYNETHIGLGRGGGLGIFFSGSANGNTFQITECQFERNRAVWGGAMYVLFGDTSISNTVNIKQTSFDKNTCHPTSGVSGGAMRIWSVLDFHNGSLINSTTEGNRVTVNGVFSGNSALQGGAISFSPTYETGLSKEQTTYLKVVGSSFSGNVARLGAAIHAELSPLFTYGHIHNVTIRDCTFMNNSIQYDQGASNYTVGIGTIYSYGVPLNFESRAHFLSNFGSALALTSTYADFFDSNTTFEGNRGDTGGAIAFLGSSHAIVNANTSMSFTRNLARKGGAIYNLLTGQGAMRASTACFFQYSDPFVERSAWKASFVFTNNTSIDGANNSIYTTSVYPCVEGNIGKNINLSRSLLFCHNQNWKFVGSECTKEIETEGSLYKFENDSYIISFPGKGFDLPIRVYDDLGHDITDSTGYTSTVSEASKSSSSTVARVDPRFSSTSDNFLRIVGQENATVKLELQSSGSRPHYLQMDVMLQTCPPGFYFKANGTQMDVSVGTCACRSQFMFGKKLNCSLEDFEASIPWNFWIGPDPMDERSDQLVMGEVPNIYSEQEFDVDYKRVLPKSFDDLDKVVCGNKSRTGPMCGKCMANYSTSVNSYNYICTRCDDDTDFVKNVFIFMIFAYLPYIILLGAIAYFNLKLTSSATNGFILYAQMTSLDIFDINGSSRLTFQTASMHKAYLFVYGIFNFNSFANVMKPFCIHRNWTALDVFLLEYTLAVLPIVFILFLYLLLRFKSIKFLCCGKRRNPLSIQDSLSLSRRTRRKKSTKESSLIHTLVAFILLSYTKLTLVSMKILAVQKLFDEEGNYLSDPRVYLAGHLSFFSKEYLLPYGAIAVIMMLIFALIPPLFLLGLPQLIDRLLDVERFSCFKKLWPSITVHIFLDAFQGFYKPNFRIFAGLYFVFRLVVLIIYVSTSNYLNTYLLQQFFIVLMIILLAIFKPYKREVFNIVDILIFLNLAMVNMITTYVYASSLTISGLKESVTVGIYALQFCLLWLPIVYMLSYLTYKLLVQLGVVQRISQKMHGRRSYSYFSDTSLNESLQSRKSESDDDGSGGSDDNRDSLSDSALFSRAKATNKFRPGRSSVRGSVHTKTYVDIRKLGAAQRLVGVTTLTGDSESRSEYDTDTTENETNSR